MKQPPPDLRVASIKYEELEIEVARCTCGQPEVRVLSSAFDRPRERFQPAYEATELNRRLEMLDRLMLQGDGNGVAAERNKLATSIGTDLYRALLPGRVHGTLARSLARLQTLRDETRPHAGLRLRLGFGNLGAAAAEVVGLPWELLCEPDTQTFLGSSPETPLARYLDLDRAVKAVAVRPPLRILAVLSSPKDLRQIDLAYHRKLLTAACPVNSRLNLEFITSPTLDAMYERLDEERRRGLPFHAIHFLGHGAFDEDGRGFLNFEDDQGRSVRTSGQVLAQQLRRFSELRLAVLSTCVGARMARHHGQHPFTGSASALVAAGFPAVVAMQFPVSETAAANFTNAFYRHLGNGRPLEEAVTEGRLSIVRKSVNSIEWASPVLFLRARSGRLFNLEQNPGKALDSAKPEQAPGGSRTNQEANVWGADNTVVQAGGNIDSSIPGNERRRRGG